MGFARSIRLAAASCAALVILAVSAPAQQVQSSRVLIDRVVAVVNNTAILQSDLDREMHLSALEPGSDQPADARGALDRLISRTLIQQQIRREEEQAAQPSEEEVQARLAQLRAQLPACVRMNCATDSGWAAFLAANGLNEAQVRTYLRMRLQMLAFIENRFQQGIRISQEDIDAYYNKTLLPEYPKNQPVPPLSSVSPRIEEILLQERVNSLFDAWLDNLRKQGDVEILDPALESQGRSMHGGEGD